MKNVKLKLTKFNLEKFEIVKLSDMKSIKGGDVTESTSVSTIDTGRLSSRFCTSLVFPSL